MQRINAALAGIALLVELLMPANLGSQTQQKAVQHEQTGNEFLRDCTNTLRLLDGDLQLTGDELSVAFHCGGYLLGFIDGYVVSGAVNKALSGSSRPLMCLPEGGIPEDQAVRVVVKWMRGHPQDLNRPARILVTIALEQAFPCK